jgi:alpha-L-rhamnosidase
MKRKYARSSKRFARHFDKQFVHDDGFVAGADNSESPFGQINNPDAKSQGGDTQTGYVLALHMNLLPENLRAAAAKSLPTRSKPITACSAPASSARPTCLKN